MITYEDFKKLDLRVATVIEAKPHPNADKLLLVTVDAGEGAKQLVAGIRNTYTPEELTGKKVIVVNNLEPAVIRGETSNGMILCASSENGPIILLPERDVPAGAIVK